MKVLMFGWEFPPHISGGLGTACFGLTHSLGKEEVDVLFVVPKLHGDETSDRIQLINASEVLLNAGDLHKKSRLSSGASSSKKGSKSYITSTGKKISVTEEKGFTYVEVPSGLS